MTTRNRRDGATDAGEHALPERRAGRWFEVPADGIVRAFLSPLERRAKQEGSETPRASATASLSLPSRPDAIPPTQPGPALGKGATTEMRDVLGPPTPLRLTGRPCWRAAVMLRRVGG